MAGVDLSQPILGAGASAQCDFAAAQARTGLNFQGDARFKRGFKAEIGLEAFANASAELSKFVHASIEGTAFARAKAGVQLQLPLNLFGEFGFAARAEAIAEAAAGVVVDLGLSIRSFLELAHRDNDLGGLPLDLILILIEEVNIGGAFEVNVSASAKAHASVTVTGCVIEKGGDKAGFFYTVDGLAAGVGMGFKAGAEFRDFRRFYGRAVDKSVDFTIHEIVRLIPPELHQINPFLEAFAPVAKMVLRIAYDIGLKIAQNNPGTTKADMAVLCDEAVKTVLEESQRFIVGTFLEKGLESIRTRLERQIPIVGQAAWAAAIQERQDLADQLLRMPAEPFQDSQDNIDYWKNLIAKALHLVATLGSPDPDLTSALCIVYCTSELALEAVRVKVNKASAYATAIGAGQVNTDATPFKGSLSAQPDPTIKLAINAVVDSARNPTQDLTYADLLQFLANDVIVNNVLALSPTLHEFMNIFAHDFAQAENELLKLLLLNANSFDPTNPAATGVDPYETLRLIVSSLDTFIVDTFKKEILPQILDNVSDANLRLYIQEVLFEAVVYVKDVALHSLLNWEGSSFDNDDFTESLAGVMMLLLGRTVIIVGDTFLTATQEQIGAKCTEVANKIRNNQSDIRVLNLPVDPDVIRITADCVDIAGEVLGPLEDETRARVRNLLYQIFEPVRPGAEQAFSESLADQFFIPNGDDLHQVTDELAAISRDRFGLFVQKFVLKIGDYVLGQLEGLILAAIDLVAHWEEHLAQALTDLAAVLRNLENTIKQLNEEIIAAFVAVRAAFDAFFQSLGSAALRNSVRGDIEDTFVDKAFNALKDNDVYKSVPSEWRAGAENLVRAAVREVLNNPVVNPVFDAIGLLADQLDELLPDMRELDPDENLPEQVMVLVLDKIEDNIRSHFAGGKPHISPSIDFSFQVWEFYDWDWHLVTHHVHIPLGTIEMNIEPFLDLVRDSIRSVSFYHELLNAACLALAQGLAKELELAAQKLERDSRQSDRTRLAKIDAEHNNEPKDIAVLSPLSLSHYTSPVDVKIHLGGVTMSCLGLGRDEMQRVLIYVNGALIPAKALVVEGSLGVKSRDAHLQDVDFGRLSTFNPASGIIRNAKASILTSTSDHFPSQLKNTQRANDGKAFPFSTSAFQEQPSSKAVYHTVGKNQGHEPYVETNAGRDKGGRFVSSYSVVNTLPGRTLSASKVNALLQHRMAGILIQFRMDLDEPFIAEGVNVLTVVVIERGGNRHQQNVSFTVSHAPRTTKPLPGVVRVLDPKTGKATLKTITVNSVIGGHDAGRTEPRKSRAVVVSSRPKANPIRRETVDVLNDRGRRIESVEIVYGADGSRDRALRDKGLDKKTLAAKRARLRTSSIAYEQARPAAAADASMRLLAVDAADIRKRQDAARTYLEEQARLNFTRSNVQ